MAIRATCGWIMVHIKKRTRPRLVALQLAGLLQCRGALLARSLALLLPAPSRRRRRAAATQAGLGLANAARRMRRDAALDRFFDVLQWRIGVEKLT